MRRSLEKTAALWSEGRKQRGWRLGHGLEMSPEMICLRWDADPGVRRVAAAAAAVVVSSAEPEPAASGAAGSVAACY